MEPSFTYIKNPDNGNKESVTIETKTIGEQNKEIEVIKKKKHSKRYGSSLGWGWFQGFNLFITGSFLLICIIFAYFMMGGESRHEGPPKYSIDRTNDLGKAIFNPMIPAEVRETYIYKPPIRRPKTDNKPILDEIQLISEAGTNTVDLPALSLVSSAEEAKNEHDQANDNNFYGDAPFGLNMQELQLESSANQQDSFLNTPNNNPQVNYLLQQANTAWNRGQLSEPYNDSALSFYRQALDADPNNQTALAGIDRLATHYLNLANNAINQGDTFIALDYTDLGLKADPLNPELNQLKSRLIDE